jgi:hypothetical protein
VVHDQLAVTVEQVAHGHPAIRPVEFVLLIKPHPGQPPAFGGDFIAEPGQLLLPAEQGQPGSSPFVWAANAGHRGRRWLVG